MNGYGGFAGMGAGTGLLMVLVMIAALAFVVWVVRAR